MTSTALPDPRASFDAPLEPVYPLGPAGNAIVLFDGEIGGLAQTARQGRVELTLSPKPSLDWVVDLDDDVWPGQLKSAVDLRIHRNGADWTISAFQRRHGNGWINTASFGENGAQLNRVLLQWINLPSILGPIPLTSSTKGHTTRYAGRWQADIDDWSMTLDLRPDHIQVFKDADTGGLCAVTHTMEITRTDGSFFTVQAAEALIEALRVSMSFGFGRWVAPILPVGFDTSGVRSWESWTSPLCDPMRRRSDGWLSDMHPADLTEYLSKALASLNDATRPETTRFQMLFAVEAAGGGTFVEQRLVSAFSAIENLEWVSLVLSGQVTERDYKNSRIWPGAKRLRTVLASAKVPLDIDASSLPALAKFAKDEGLTDGPAAVVEVRNRLMHPKRLRDDVYHISGLSVDAWLLARHYANLLILHSIDYRGSYQRLLPPFGWAGTVSLVPWAVIGP